MADGGSSLATNPVWLHLAPLPMTQRRKLFVFLIGPSFGTLDAMQAFGASVHLVVHPDDLANIRAILNKSLIDFKLFYRVYLDRRR